MEWGGASGLGSQGSTDGTMSTWERGGCQEGDLELGWASGMKRAGCGGKLEVIQHRMGEAGVRGTSQGRV